MADREVGFVVNDEYKTWIETIKSKVKHSQIKASMKANYKMLGLYQDTGRDIVVRQKHTKWDNAFLTIMSRDLKKTFPDMSGFSIQNLKSIRYRCKSHNSDENSSQAISQSAV